VAVPCLAWVLAACAATATAAAPDLGDLLRPMPLSAPTPTATPGQPQRAFTPLSESDLGAGHTSMAQVLGSTTSGTLVKAYAVTHMRAADVATLVADPAAPLLPRDFATVIVDARSNTLLVKGTEADHQLVENLLRRVDLPAKQVLVEVKIVSADEYFGKSLGARFGITSSRMLTGARPRDHGAQVGGSLEDLNQIATTGASSFVPNVSLPARNTLTSEAVSNFAFGFFKLPAGINIGLEISALEEAGHTKVLSSPKLVLSNQRPGLISSGQRIPYSKPSLVQGVSTTEFIDVKVAVAVTALVALDGSITMDLTLTDDSVGANSNVGPTINTHQATSNVTLQSGETLLLGGFQSSTNVNERNQTPLLGDLPVVGNLFRNQSNSTVRRELLFIITPTIIEGPVGG
jgi:type IV pilus assembly protein PilQ